MKVSSERRGIQLWTVPTSGIWSIEARGASGADGILAGGSRNKRRGGYGAIVKAKFQLHKGKILKILVGHEGLRDYREAHRPGGGGGGTFVVNQDGRPLIVAGGGGGGGLPKGGENVSFCNLTTIKTVKKFTAKTVDEDPVWLSMLIGSPEKRFNQLFCIAIFSISI